MKLQLKRSHYKKAFCLVKDRCDQKDNLFDDRGQFTFKNMTIKPMNKIVTVNLSIVRETSEGRWIYAMLIPDALPQIENDKYLEA